MQVFLMLFKDPVNGNTNVLNKRAKFDRQFHTTVTDEDRRDYEILALRSMCSIFVTNCALTFIDDPVVVDSAEMNSNGQSTASTPRTGSGGVAQAANLVGQNLNHNDLGGSTTTGGFSDELDDPNAPINQDFMVSLLVDARGGAMHGCRYSGVKVQAKN
ncbi:hypothetical protein TCAL_17108 [Tigriopus californicus]|uniref:Uncharacterized protein n=1 Tax=Tigriopus californicus TaxID=6832 RepID=A0A553P302_TIGCA|nr:hypothetical protein TCAL_17108 [Tigriopus californicus]